MASSNDKTLTNFKACPKTYNKAYFLLVLERVDVRTDPNYKTLFKKRAHHCRMNLAVAGFVDF